MDEQNSEEYYNSLYTQPNHSNYNEYDYATTSAPENKFCSNDIEVEIDSTTESEASLGPSSKSNANSPNNKITPEKPSIPGSIHCETLRIKNVKGKQHTVYLTVYFKH